eukprot:TRINITY_DN6071_c0_g1_i1.p1 TRINITY_DN6071_c0_g1~~TRINITY_DN6071_c0_g1_i1.p1  ORF type:complete len:263 (+),score=88.70 TRINITY_DN6071_c0_g1_i1:752-1540(+)
MDTVAHVASTLLEKTEYVRDNVDWAALWDDVKYDKVVYLSVFFLLSKLVVRRVPETFRKGVLIPFLKVYNAGMVVFSFWCFVGMVGVLQEVEVFSDDCEAAFAHEKFNLIAKLFYLSKFVEYIDSWSLAMAGKPVSILQTFHHFGAPLDMFILYHSRNESIWIFVLLNSFVHTVMYFYYFLTLCKIPFPGKVLITVMQITQFNVGFYLVWTYKDIPCFAASPLRMLSWLFTYAYVGVVLLLFINFSLWTYIFPAEKKTTKRE